MGRETVLNAMRSRTERASADPSLLFGPEATAEVHALEDAFDLMPDLPEALALGDYYWRRSMQSKSPTDSMRDIESALRYLLPIFWKNPDMVPLRLREALTNIPSLRPLVQAGARELSLAAYQYVKMFNETRDASHLEAACIYFRAAFARTPSDDPLYPLRLSDIGVCLRDRYKETRERMVLRELLKVERAAVGLARGREEFSERVASLVFALSLEAARDGRREAYDVPIQAARDALADPTAQADQYPDLLNTLGGALRDKHGAVGDPAALRECVSVMRQAATLTRQGVTSGFDKLHNLAVALTSEYERTHDIALLSEKLAVVRELVRITPESHPRYAGTLASLSSTLLEVCIKGEPRDPHLVDECVDTAARVLETLPPDAPDRYQRLNVLALAYETRFATHAQISDLRRAVDLFEESARATPHTRQGRGAAHTTLCGAAELLFETTRDTEDLKRLVAALQEAVTILEPTDPATTDHLDRLGNHLVRLYRRDGDVSRLQRAVDACSRAVAATPRDHPARAERLTHLGGALGELYAQTGEVELARRALSSEREAVELTPPNDFRRPLHLNNLSSALQRLYLDGRDVSLLHEAVRASREAVASAGPDDPNRAVFLSGLGGALREIYLHDEHVGQLEQFVQAERDAVAAAGTDHPDRAMLLNNLASALQLQWMRTSKPEHLAEMVATMRAALTATPPNEPARIGRELNLITGLEISFDETGDFDKLREAVTLARSVAERTPPTHPQRARRLGPLVNILLSMFENSGDVKPDGNISISVDQAAQFVNPIADSVTRLLTAVALNVPKMLDEAVTAAREIVRLTPTRTPERALNLDRLARVLEAQAKHRQQRELLDEARRTYREAGSDTSGSVYIRIHALRGCARLSNAPEHAESGLLAMEEAVDLLGVFAPDSLLRSDREFQLSRMGGLPEEAAAAALYAGRPDRAVELLERTRGILAAGVLAQREHDTDQLRTHAPELAERLDRLRSLANASAPNDPDSQDALARDRRTAATQWQPLIREIRKVPGFEGFMRTATVAELLPGLVGPVVYLVAGESRSDALILDAAPTDTDDPVRVVPLIGLNHDEAYQHVNRIRTATQLIADDTARPERRIGAQQRILDTLTWMWDRIAGPVLDELGYVATPADGEGLPKIWWCPVGVLSALPLHAAGHHPTEPTGIDALATDTGPQPAGADTQHQLQSPHHPDESGQTVFDRAVSSYTTTLGAMARHRHNQNADAPRKALIVTSAGTGRNRLSAVAAEAEAINRLALETHRLDDPTPDEVIAALPEYDVAHFACHAISDPDEPSRSRLLLGGPDGAQLTISDIGGLEIDSALAYLSACETTLPAPRLADEALHLTGAFHLAGFRHVVGSLWSIDDKAAAEIAKEFYGGLGGMPASALDTDRSAQALNDACRRQRNRFPKTPSRWAAHIHVGW